MLYWEQISARWVQDPDAKPLTLNLNPKPLTLPCKVNGCDCDVAVASWLIRTESCALAWTHTIV